MFESLRATLRLLRSESLLVILLAVAALTAALAPPAPARRVDVGASGDAAWLADMWQPEQSGATTFRWTNGDSALSLAGYATSAPLLVTLRMAAPLADHNAGTPLTLLSDGFPAGTFPLTSTWRVYHVLAAPDGRFWKSQILSLQSPTVPGGPDDHRALGLTLSEAVVQASEASLVLPQLWRVLVVIGIGLLIRLWCALPKALRRTSRQESGAADKRAQLKQLIGGGSALGLALLCWLASVPIEGWWPSFWTGWLGFVLLLTLWLWIDLRPRAASLTLLGGLSLLLALLAGASLSWRVGQDLSIMHYLGIQIVTHGVVPYRDFFEQNAPGIYLFHGLLAAFVGPSEPGLRVADLGILAILLALTVGWMRQIADRAAWVGALLFGITYLCYGPPMGMQREFLILLPIAGSLLIASLQQPGPLLRSLLVGICFGISMTIKPHAAIGAPLVVLAITWSEEPVHGLQGFSGLLRLGLAMGVGLAIPLLAMLAYLAAQGALPAFLDIVQHYWPLYSELNIVHQIVAPADRPAYLVTTFFTEIRKLVPWAPAILGAGLASARANLSSRQRSWVGLLWALAVAYTLYPIPAGKFWNYHWLPATYCYALLGGLCLLPPRDPYPAASSQSSAVSSHRSWFRVLRSAAGNRWPAVASILPVLMLGVTLIWRVQPPDEFGDVVAGSRVVLPKIERIDRIAAVLRARLQPGDTVQPLDWTGGAGQAMMIANARPATDFVEDFYFYHHIDDPYIQMLRQRFITQFDAARPRFVIQITAENKPWPSGPRTTREFPELTQRLTRDYRVVLEGDGYRVLERISG